MKRNKIFSTVAALVATLFAASAVLVCGCGLFGYTDTKTWILNTVKSNYYYYDEMDKEGLEDLTIEEIVSRLDIYSEFYTAEELLQLIKDNSGEKAGVGISYIFLEEGACSLYPEGGGLLIMVVGNSPADRAGLRKGLLLTEGTFAGNTVRFDTSDAANEFFNPIAAGVEFTLTASTGESFTVSKQEYNASYMFMATNETAWKPTFNNNGEVNGVAEVEDRAIEYLPYGAAYVSMSQFYGNAADEFGCLMTEFNAEGCTSLILDLRDNGGGYVDVMQDMAGYFTSSLGNSSYCAMTAKYKSGKQEIYNCKPHSGNSLVSTDTTVYVLANSGTASASEALIGVLISYGFLQYQNIILSDYGTEFLNWVGEDYGTAKSYGKGIMQTTFTKMFTGEALKLTTAQIYWPNGKCIHGVGLTAADGCRTVETDWLVTPDDGELQNIIEMIK